ncbi:MAG TPA: hypothetical protein VFU02_05515 [Polyangiaceae bacterium]|nr:hypothetical protein [Polyangiaceae bacterium]
MKPVIANTAALLVALLVVPQVVGCKKGQLEPEFASSAEQPSYAKTHPDELKSTVAEFEGQLTLVDTMTAEFKEYPGQLKDPDWKEVIVVVDRADVEGRSPHFAAELEDNGTVASFYEQEKPELHKRVGGAAQYQAKEKGCDADVYGSANYALDKGIEKSLEDRTHKHSEAHAHIQMHQSKLGKANIEALETQADHIALASYVAHVGLVRSKQDLDRLLADASGVESTLNDRIEELKALPVDEKAPATEKKAREDELAALEAARTTLGQELEPARKQAETMEQRMTEAKQKYSDALKQLKEALEQNSAAQTK